MSMTESERVDALARFREHLAPILDDQLTKHGVELMLELACTTERTRLPWNAQMLRAAALEYQNESFRARGQATPNKVICPGCDSVDCEHTGPAGDLETATMAMVVEQAAKLVADLKTAGVDSTGRPHHDDHRLAAGLVALGWRRP